MKIFTVWQIKEAIAYAKAGGQALHLHNFITDSAPACFRAAVNRGENIAHLFDLDELRLAATAKRLGVRVIYIDRAGTDRQHIDLCSGPLTKAILEAEDAEA